MSDTKAGHMGLGAQLRSFPNSFWVANLMEMVERLAFFGVRAIAALYIVAAAEDGGLGFSNTDKGIFFGVWALIQCLLPMFTGGFADRYGYRLSLLVAFTINITGYTMMAFCQSWALFMMACCLIGVGTAIFKPPLHGTIAHCVTEKTSSVGWGVFYMVVNVGGFVGPFFAGYLRLMEWKYAFLFSAAVMSINYIPTLFFLKDYSKEVDRDHSKGMGQVWKETFAVLKDARFMVFLAIFSGFWLMFMQLFDALPIYIDQWVNSSDVMGTVASVTGSDRLAELADQGKQVNPEWIVNVDAGSIVILVLLVTYISGKFSPIAAMVVGMFIACGGLLVAGTATTGWMCVFGIFIFAIGEMACSPKFSEYVGLMATPEKKALYMGYSNIPFAVGWSVGNFAGGFSYDAYSDKYKLAVKHMTDVLGVPAEQLKDIKQSDIMPTLADKLGVDVAQAQQVLWDKYHPQYFWIGLTILGLICTLAMLGYHFWLKKTVAREAA